MSNPYLDIRTQQLPGLGRESSLKEVTRRLCEGNHVSLVSPKYMGKSCFLRALVRSPELRDQFLAIGLCDVRHEPLPNNEAFFAYVLNKLETDPDVCPDWKEFTIFDSKVGAWPTLYNLGKGLAYEKRRMLVVLDGLDQLAFNSGVDEAAWNNMNSLIDTGGIQFVTASCDGLDHICLDPQSRGSLFFQRFGEAVALPPVDEVELVAWLDCAPCGADAFDRGARTELLNQTGGHPKLLSALLGRLPDGGSAVEVKRVADSIALDGGSDLEAVFRELSSDLREALATLDEAGRTTAECRRALLARCLVAEVRGGKLEQRAQMLAKLAEEARPGESTLRNLFGSEAGYFLNAASALHLRLKQVIGISQAQIFRYVEKVVENLDKPECAVMMLRNVEDEAYREIDNCVAKPFPRLEVANPPTGFKYRGENQRSHNSRVVEFLSRGDAGYLNEKISRELHILVALVHGFGNFANHTEGRHPSAGVALAGASAAIELAAEMKRTGLIR